MPPPTITIAGPQARQDFNRVGGWTGGGLDGRVRDRIVDMDEACVVDPKAGGDVGPGHDQRLALANLDLGADALTDQVLGEVVGADVGGDLTAGDRRIDLGDRPFGGRPTQVFRSQLDDIADLEGARLVPSLRESLAKLRTDQVVGSPLYQMPSCEVSP